MKLLDKDPNARFNSYQLLEDPVMKPYILKFLE